MAKRDPLVFLPGEFAAEGPIHYRIPEGDNRERLICDDCGFVRYVNPLVVVGAVVTWEDKFLLCKRAIEPRKGFWTMPAGFLEQKESTIDGAKREAWEEAHAEIDIDALLGIYNIARISQIQMIYRARLLNTDFHPGIESEEVALFTWDEIPWDEIAFPSVHWALEHYQQTLGQDDFAPRPEGPMGL